MEVSNEDNIKVCSKHRMVDSTESKPEFKCEAESNDDETDFNRIVPDCQVKEEYEDVDFCFPDKKDVHASTYDAHDLETNSTQEVIVPDISHTLHLSTSQSSSSTGTPHMNQSARRDGQAVEGDPDHSITNQESCNIYRQNNFDSNFFVVNSFILSPMSPVYSSNQTDIQTDLQGWVAAPNKPKENLQSESGKCFAESISNEVLSDMHDSDPRENGTEKYAFSTDSIQGQCSVSTNETGDYSVCERACIGDRALQESDVSVNSFVLGMGTKEFTNGSSWKNNAEMQNGEVASAEQSVKAGGLEEINLQHNDGKRFACNQCEKTFKLQKSLRRHYAIHSGESLVCEVCGKEFRSKYNLRDHCLRIHNQRKSCEGISYYTALQNHKSIDFEKNENRYVCDLCERVYKDSTALKRHRITHYDKEFTCEICGTRFHQKRNLERHGLIHVGDKCHQCDECGKCFVTFDSLRLHSKIHKKDRDVFNCDECGKSFTAKNYVKKHKLSVHNKERPYICEICDKKFPNKTELKLHMCKHLGQNPYKCGYCSESFATKSRHRLHISLEHKKISYNCQNCEKTFPLAERLREHVAQVHRDKPHTCDVCGESFSLPSQLEKHSVFHDEKRKYECSVCKKRFTKSEYLHIHIKTHKDKQYECKECGKLFTQKCTLNGHYKAIHAKERLHACDVCGKRFLKGFQMRMHKTRVHENKCKD